MTTIIRMPEVERRTAMSGSRIYRLMGRGEFPRSVKIGARAVGWSLEEINSYIERKFAMRDREEDKSGEAK